MSRKKNLNKFDIERGLISKLVETKDINLIKDLQIKTMYFSGKHQKVFKYINDLYLSTGEFPTFRAITNKFNDYEFETYINKDADESVGTEESLRYWCDQIRNKTKHNKLVDSAEKIVESLEDMKTEDAYSVMKKTVMYIENEVEETSAVDITEDTASRKLAYLERKKNKGMIGIPTGIDKLDYILKGLQLKQLITLIASTGVGKTWLEVIIGANAQLNNYSVLQFVTEMSEEQMRDRYEAVLMGLVVGDFNYNKFKSGSLTEEQEEAYFNFLDNIMPRMDSLIIETATGVSNMAAKIDQYQPDLVLVDGAYLMTDDEGSDQDWLRVAHITRGIKKLAKSKKIPIFINSQADSTTSVKKGPQLGNIGYSKAIGQDSDVVLALFRDSYMIEDNEMEIRVLKQREGTLGKVRTNWDFNVMNFDSIYSEVQSGEESEDLGESPEGVLEEE